MKTIYFTIVFLATVFSLQAQNLLDEQVAPYVNSHTASSQNFSSAGDLNFGMGTSPFFDQDSPPSPSEDWLYNLFGADYAKSDQGYLDTPYGSPENASKIPIKNGTMTLTLIVCLYVLILFIRKKLRIIGFA